MSKSLSALGLSLVACLMASPAAAQSTPPSQAKPMEKMEHHASSGWKELDVFHEVMAASWHPAAKGDLSVIRVKADSLVATAKRWSEAKVPTACDKKEVRDAIADVLKGSEGVATLVKSNAADADLKKALSDVHDRFEVVEHGCHVK
jgi:hypothetical protein